MDKRVVRVALNEGKGEVAFVVGKEKIEPNEYDKREHRFGLSVFYRETAEGEFKYILNYCLSDDEVVLLSSPSKVKSVDDLNYILLANHWKMRIFKNHVCYMGEKSSLVKEIVLDHPAGYSSMQVVSQLDFTSNNENGFVAGLELAMAFPFTTTNIFHSMPEHTPEEEVEL